MARPLSFFTRTQVFARQLAHKSGQEFIGTHDLLLGMLCTNEGHRDALLVRKGITFDSVEADVRNFRASKTSREVPAAGLQLSSGAKEVLNKARRIASGAGHRVDLRILLIALLEHEEGFAHTLLKERGLRLAQLAERAVV